MSVPSIFNGLWSVECENFPTAERKSGSGKKREEPTSKCATLDFLFFFITNFSLWYIWKTYFSHNSINVSKEKMYTWSRARMFAIRVQIIYLNCANMGDSVEVTGSNCSRRETTKTCNFCLSWEIVL